MAKPKNFFLRSPVLPRSFGVVALSGFAWACAGEPALESVDTKEQNIWGAANDADTLEANAIVNVGGGCSGTLITPRIVLTAAHCTSAGSSPDIRFGFDRQLHDQRSVPTLTTVAHPNYNRDLPNAPHPSDFDIALVYLAEPVFDQAKLRRPSLVPPTNFDSIGMSGWSPCGHERLLNQEIPNSRYRQAAVFVNGFYESQTGPDALNLRNEAGSVGATWVRDSERTGVCFGDSGGALFVAHPDGTRETFGVTSWVSFFEGGVAIGAGFADITTEAARSWILDNVLDSEVHGLRSAAWLAAHGKTSSTFWYGEGDYTGVCDTARDPDCDYWYSEHDDAPNTYNPEQTDDSEPEPEPTTPCSQLCTNPLPMTSQYFGSGNLGSQPTCHETTYPMNGLTCGNLAAGRQLRINGQTVQCGTWIQVPAPRNGGYCVQTTAGGADWAFFQTW